MVATLPAQGTATWTDNVDNWRKSDAQWLQERGILRFADATARDAALVAPPIGQVVYNQATDSLELRGSAAAWRAYKALPANLTAVTDTAAAVFLAHVGGTAKGISLWPVSGINPEALVSLNAPLATDGGVLTATTTGIRIQTGAKSVVLTTSATSLVSDSPLSVPSIALTGAGTVLSAPAKTIAVGTVTADSGTIATLNATAASVSGVLTAGGGSNLAGVTFPGNYVQAASGYVSQWGYFQGDGNGAIMRARNPSSGVLGAAYIQTVDASINFYGGVTDVWNSLRLRSGAGIMWYNASATIAAPIAPVVYSAGDPGASNYPDGTLWIT